MNKKIIILFSLLFFSGCTTNGFMFRSFGDYHSKESATPVYKIGDPYQIKGVLYTPKEDYAYSETGIAGWYTASNAHITSNGEKYDPTVLSAAHKTLPLPSMVKITNLENNKTAIVRVNERGPFVNNRLIDVSQKAAEELGFEFNKTTLVRVEILPDESQALKASLPLTEPEKTPVLTNEPITVDELKPIYEPEENFLQPIYPPQEQKGEEPQKDLNEAKTTSGGYYIQYGAFKNNDNALKLKEKIDLIYPTFIQENQTQTDLLYRVRSGPFDNQEKANSVLDKITQEGYGNYQLIYEQ